MSYDILYIVGVYENLLLKITYKKMIFSKVAGSSLKTR